MDMKLETTIGGLKILQVMNQELGLMSKIDLLKILLDKINTRGLLQKI